MLHTLTVGELIERLREQDSNARVVFASDYGDRCHTQQAHEVDGEFEPARLVRSGYSASGYAVKTADELQEPLDDGWDDDVVLVLR